MPVSSITFVSSSTKSGMPSARSTISSVILAESELRPARIHERCPVSSSEAIAVTWAWPAQGGWNGERKVMSSRTGRRATRSTLMSNSSGNWDQASEHLRRSRAEAAAELRAAKPAPRRSSCRRPTSSVGFTIRRRLAAAGRLELQMVQMIRAKENVVAGAQLSSSVTSRDFPMPGSPASSMPPAAEQQQLTRQWRQAQRLGTARAPGSLRPRARRAEVRQSLSVVARVAKLDHWRVLSAMTQASGSASAVLRQEVRRFATTVCSARSQRRAITHHNNPSIPSSPATVAAPLTYRRHRSRRGRREPHVRESSSWACG